MTTIYIEEITSDENHDHDHSHGDSIECHDNNCLIKTERRIFPVEQNDKNKTPKLLHDNLKSCPLKIGGGATISIIETKGYVFGGCNRSGKPSAQVHCYDFNANEWHCNLQCKGCPPPAMFGHTAVTYQSNIYIFGGQGLAVKNSGTNNKTSSDQQSNSNSIDNQLTSLNCMYGLNTKTLEWTNMTTKNDSSPLSLLPPQRNSHTCVLSKSKNDDDEESLRFIIFGGANETVGPMNDVWSFPLTTNTNNKKKEWNKVTCVDGRNGVDIPSPREMHSACIDEEGNSMYVIGGRNREGSVCQDLWVLNLESNIWNQIDTTPSPRCAHTANLLRYESKRIIAIYGGWDGAGTLFNDFLLFDLKEKKWHTNLLHSPSPAITSIIDNDLIPRFGHASDTLDVDTVQDNERKLCLFGGVNTGDDLGDLMTVQLTYIS